MPPGTWEFIVGGMGRGIRVEYSGIVYQVMSRGDQREPIFVSDDSREVFLTTLGEGGEQNPLAGRARMVMTWSRTQSLRQNAQRKQGLVW